MNSLDHVDPRPAVDGGMRARWLGRFEAIWPALRLFLIWRAALLLVGFVGVSQTNEMPDFHARTFPNHYFLDGHVRWDSRSYAAIADHGYVIDGPRTTVTFFPLYPYLARYLGRLVGNVYIAGLLLSQVFSALAAIYIYLIGVRLFDRGTAERALMLLFAYPSSYFLTSFYTESLFLFTSAATVYAFLEGRYLASGWWGLLAGLTRPAGAMLFLTLGTALAIEMLRRRKRFERSMLWLTLMLCSYPIFMGMLQQQVGDPLAFVRYQRLWNRRFTSPLVTLSRAIQRIDFSFPRDGSNMYGALEVVTALSFIGLSVAMAWMRMPPVLWLFTLGSVVFPLSTGKMLSIIRFTGVIFPAFLGMGRMVRRPTTLGVLLFCFSFLLAIFYMRFINWWFSA